LDIVPIAPQNDLPPNVMFVLHDITQRFRFPTGSIDFIHARDVSSMSGACYLEMLCEASRTLRPGGLLLLCQWDRSPALCHSTSDSGTQIPGAHGFYRAFIDCLERVKGIRQLPPDYIPDLLQRTNAFGDIHVRKYIVPIGDWPSDYRVKNLGVQFRDSVKVLLDSSRPLLRQGGYSDGLVEFLIHAYRNEMYTVGGMVSFYHMIWASRL